MKGPLASIVVTNFNYGRFLAEAIRSALNQTYAATEVIVVDDGSTDDSGDIIQGFSESITLVRKSNGGQGSALNAGFRASHGEFVIFLDADDILHPTLIERVADAFAAPEVVKVHWPMLRVDVEGRSLESRVPEGLVIEGDLRELIIKHGPENCGEPRSRTPPGGGSAYARSLLEQTLPMDEGLYRYGADMYLLNLAPIFGTIRAIQEPLSFYRFHGGNDTLKPLEHLMGEFFPRYEDCCRVLSRHLGRMGVEVSPMFWKRETWYHKIRESFEDIERVIPETAAFILADDMHWQAGDYVAGRRRIPFMEREGLYWGQPADDQAAIQELERLRGAGARAIVFVWSNFWFLDHYAEFSAFLRANFPCPISNDRVIIFDLS